DFAAEGRLIDMSTRRGDEGIKVLDELVRERRVDLVLQIGSPPAYAQLPYLKEMHPGLPIVDTLYIKAAHALSYCLVEACFDGVIVESRDMRDFVVSASAKPDPCVRIVENGVDLSRFIPSTREVRDRIVVGFIGRMAPEKNPLAFVELAERLHAKLPAASWRMSGEGPMDSAVRERVAAASRAGVAISFEGHLGRPEVGYAQIDVLIVPSSKAEGRPNVVMEANACGVPVIGAPAGAIPELIEEGRNGFVLRPSEFGRIGDLLAGWMSDPASLDRLRKTSREVAEARFDAVKMFDAYEAAFQAFASHSA
ncbi:MAG: glycosyltransferase family 4 protein, partial [Roseiarcus sp.]